MKIAMIKKYGLEHKKLPQEIYGSFWLEYKDAKYKTKKLINVTAEEGQWKITSDADTKIIVQNNQIAGSVYLQEYGRYFLQTEGEDSYIILYCIPDYSPAVSAFGVVDNAVISVGNSHANNIAIDNPFLKEKSFQLEYKDKNWTVNKIETKILYVNDEPLVDNKLKYGDTLFIMGVRIIVMKDFIVVDSKPGMISVWGPMFISKNIEPIPPIEDEELISEEIRLYSEEEYFHSSPRLKPGIDRLKIKIEAPPEADKGNQMPVLLTLGPMVTMALVSVLMGLTTLTNVLSGNTTLMSALPQLVMVGAMILTTLFWPMLSRKFEEQNRKEKEKKRQTRYKKYLENKKRQIEDQKAMQKQALIELFPSFEECRNIINNRKSRLWERKVTQEDFLELRLGLGDHPMIADIEIPSESFSLDDDNLKDLLYEMIRQTETIVDAPITVKLTENNLVAIIGSEKLNYGMTNSLLLQLMAFHSYDAVKVVVLTSEMNEKKWSYLKNAPHIWDDSKQIRFFGTSDDDLSHLSAYLDSQYNARINYESNRGILDGDLDYRSFRPYYVIVTDDYKEIRNLEFIKSITNSKRNIGFSLFILADRLINLPDECNFFIYTDHNMCALYEGEMIVNRQRTFMGEFYQSVNLEAECMRMSNIPIELQEEEGQLPETLGFLEMYQVGRVEQLNSLNRWHTNNPTNYLQVPIGVNKAGSLFKLDLHEKIHGPHGLIAGGTGSGKSELIITYILSMAVNYHPNEVQFVLIDYKGGGLAGVFENRETNIRLPHLAGTITNLDVVEMNRALSSIQSELRKRQAIFNEVRDSLGESTIDIYKYQRLYREGKVEKPLSHLFIISDEFAELKMQQADFMSQLISTARIGRSLGVHLILATQKPSGIVDDQIWSNSKFRICLKVQERADSVDMIKVPDAAELKKAGRFYLQVGYNEFFDLGQSAWCGTSYIPTDKPKKRVDNSISFVDNVGNVVSQIDDKKRKEQGLGEEVTHVLNYIIGIAEKENIQVEKLWQDPIPAEIFISDLKVKYNYESERRVINPIIGEYDDPNNQRQGLLTLPISQNGNTIICGMAGSGKENVLSTIIYSSILHYTADEVGFYILDCGSESLRMFKDAPQVGDVVLSHEKEKVANLFRILAEEIETRKKLLVNYNGDLELYCKNNEDDLPYIVTIINGFANFMENYEQYEDALVSLTREGEKYGLIFIFAANSYNEIRYRLTQNFKQYVLLQFTDPTDYNILLGQTGGIVPSKIVGRGLVKLDNIYEFQTAYPCKRDILTEFIKETCKSLKGELSSFIFPVPILPDFVTYNFVKERITDLTAVPIGVSKETLNVEMIDLKTNFASIISALDLTSMSSFLTVFTELLGTIGENILVVDAENLLKDISFEGINYYNRSFPDFAEKFFAQVSKQVELLEKENVNLELFNNQKHTCVMIVGLVKFIKKIESTIDVGEFFTKGRSWKNLSFIFVDEADRLREFEYEGWFKEIVDLTNGIWIGEGAGDQYTIKITKTRRLSTDDITNDFGYIVRRGSPTLIKLLNIDVDEVPYE